MLNFDRFEKLRHSLQTARIVVALRAINQILFKLVVQSFDDRSHGRIEVRDDNSLRIQLLYVLFDI